MIAEVLEFITGLKDSRPITETVGEATYAVKSDRTLGEVIRPPAPIAKPTLALATLNGFVDAIAAKVDEFPADAVAIHVESYSSVALVSLKADEFGRRHVWLRAKHEEVNPFRFERYYESPEDLLIALQGSFLPSDNLTNLLRLCSNLTAGSSVQTADDGFSQKVVIQEGGVTRGGVELPPRIALAPYRTFREITPVESDFLIRMQGKKDALPQIALFGVDGGGWKLDTVLAVKTWMLERISTILVIA
jgi:hypothetical protein